MSNPPFPAFAKSSHPDVIESIEETHRRRIAFMNECRALCEELVGDPRAGFFNGWWFTVAYMTGINAQLAEGHDLPGQWKKPDGGVLKPYKNNPIGQRMARIRYKAATIPGRGNLFMGDGRMGTGAIFLHDGAVYSSISFAIDAMSDKEQAEAVEFGWTEILASEYYVAKEAFQAADTEEKP